MKMVVGLGNPGFQYSKNRHNIGFQCLDYFADKFGYKFDKKSMNAHWTKVNFDSHDLILSKPQTFMNLSGTSVLQLVNFFKLNPRQNLLVVSDDLDLPVGKIRFRPNGSSGGQNGLKNIFDIFGTQEIQRLRVGIGRPVHGRPRDYVLNDFSREQENIIVDTFDKVAEAIEVWVKEDINKAMNLFN
jgi:PTH1 family peptidyl-tRNA hydrolase